MKIKLKILIVALIMFTLLISNIYAVDMFLSSNTNTTVNNTPDSSLTDSENDDLLSENITQNEEILDNDIVLSDYNDEESNVSLSNNEVYDNLDIEQNPVVTTTSSSSSDKLSASDIINIILIAVCIVLIFLAVAILIRLK